MTAGSPRGHHTGDPGRRDREQADRIARLYAQGMPADRITLIARCPRARVLDVARQRGWRLDAAGVLPREQRPAIVPGQPVPATGAGLIAERPRAARPLPPIPVPPPRTTPPPKPRATCSHDGCTTAAKANSLCPLHYMRARRAAS